MGPEDRRSRRRHARDARPDEQLLSGLRRAERARPRRDARPRPAQVARSPAHRRLDTSFRTSAGRLPTVERRWKVASIGGIPIYITVPWLIFAAFVVYGTYDSLTRTRA